jgi:hypothetical protein
MDDKLGDQIVAGQRHRDGVDQERHVVGDHVDHVPAGQQRGRGTRPDPDQRPALRAVSGQLRVLGSCLADPPGTSRFQVLDVDVPVVGAQVAQDGLGSGAGRDPVGRLREQCLAGLRLVIRHLFHSLVA